MNSHIKYSVGINSLQTILELSLDAESSYEQLKLNTENHHLKDWLTAKQELTTDFILGILTQLHELEIAPQSSSIMKINVDKIWLDMKLKFITIGDELIIRESHKIDTLMLNALNHEIKLGLITGKIHEFYTNYKNKLRRYLNPIINEDLQIS